MGETTQSEATYNPESQPACQVTSAVHLPQQPLLLISNLLEWHQAIAVGALVQHTCPEIMDSC
jgi:hypothetical protein